MNWVFPIYCDGLYIILGIHYNNREIIMIKNNIQIFNLLYEKDTSVINNLYDNMEFSLNFSIPYYNHSSNNNLSSIRLALFNEDGNLFLNDKSSDHSIHKIPEDTENFEEISSHDYKEYSINMDSSNKITNDRNPLVGFVDNSDLLDIFSTFDVMFDSFKTGIKLTFEEELNDSSKFVWSYLMNYMIIRDLFNYRLDDSEYLFEGAPSNSNSPPIIHTNHSIDPKVSLQNLFYHNSTNDILSLVKGSKLKYFTEVGISINGIFQKFSVEYTKYFNSYLKLFNNRNKINIITHFKIGTALGYIPFYEAFVLGGARSVRGYTDGEIGISKRIFQSSLEIWYHMDKYIDNIYLFFDYATDLNASVHLIYNPTKYKMLDGQGSSFGIGCLIGTGRLEYGCKKNDNKPFLNFEYGERY